VCESGTTNAAAATGWLLARLFLLLILLGVQLAAQAASPRLAHFLPEIDVARIFPGADRLGPLQDGLPVAPVYAGSELLGHVYVTSDVVNTRGYSSYPIDTLVAMATDGTVVGAELLEHNEPIVLIGISEARVEKFIAGYVSQNFVSNPPEPGALPPVDIISGATVTVMVIGDSIMRSSMRVARELARLQGPVQAAGPQDERIVDTEQQQVLGWDELLAQGAVARLHLTVADVNRRFAENARQEAAAHPQQGDPDDTFIDLYVALASVPSIGRSLLGAREYDYLQQRLKPGQQALLVAGNGIYSFKGSGYVRGGIFDRIEVVQDLNSFHFTDLNHQRLPSVLAEGAPRLREVALFVVPTDEAGLDPVAPWRLQLMVQREIGPNDKVFVNYNLNYELPQSFTKVVQAAAPAPAAAATAAAAPDFAAEAAAPSDLWKQMWHAKRGQIAVLVVALVILAGVFFFQNQVTANEKRFRIFRAAFLTFTLVWLGWYASAQLSVVNVLTFTHALRGDFHWEFFLMDPLVFILWVATAVSILFWNRGAFCGWLCPFGALQELTNKLGRLLHVPQVKVHFSVATRLAAIKYVIFVGLLGISFYELALAEKLAEVEPFKTAIILKFMRDWWFVLFAGVLLIAGLFIERFYCRYLCPLGAALAIPARLRIFDWLRRYHMCGNPCQLCAVECPVQAIAPEGQIQPNECIQCLNCQVLYHSEQRCPHLIARKKRGRRSKPAATGATAKPVVQAPRIVMSDT